MGWAKTQIADDEERGYGLRPNVFVCPECVDNDYLKLFLADNGCRVRCSFCDSSTVPDDEIIAAPFDDLMAVIMDAVDFDWTTPSEEHVPYSSEFDLSELGIKTAYDLIMDTEWVTISENEKLINAIWQSIGDTRTFVPRSALTGSFGKQMEYGWDRFCDQVTRQTRYLFLISGTNDADPYPSRITPADFLEELGGFINECEGENTLIGDISDATLIYRARIDRDQHFRAAKDLGAPPSERAKYPNRMSPSGIPMFYGAFDSNTACLETFEADTHQVGNFISVAQFKPMHTLSVLDLSDLPTLPSVFDPDQRRLLSALRFFHIFASDISKPIVKNGREHTEYVPTQIVTEYIRHIFRFGENQKLDGIRYRSSRAEDADAVVLFMENSNSCDPNTPPEDHHILRLETVEFKTIGVEFPDSERAVT